MKVYEPKQIRNLALLGHAGSGKTSFLESVLFESGAITRKGTIEESNTVGDYTDLEHERKCTVFAKPLYCEWNDFKLNMIDTPGYDDYFGEAVAAITVADTCAIFVNSQSGIEVGTENALDYSEKNNKSTMFIINKIDADQADFDKVSNELKDRIGVSLAVLQYPIGKGAAFNQIVDILNQCVYEYTAGNNNGVKKDLPASEKSRVEDLRSALMEAVAETDEELMTKYFDAGELSQEEIVKGLKSAFVKRQIFPVLACAGKSNVGVDKIIEFITSVAPSPEEAIPALDLDGNPVACDVKGPASLFVFKLVSEAQLGEMTYFKVMSGKVGGGMDLVNEQKNAAERFNQVYSLQGKKRADVEILNAGDIGATVKLKLTAINHTLHEKGKSIEFPKMVYPNPKVRVAVVPKTKGEEEKVGMSLHSLHQEDPSIVVEHSQELRQMIVYAQGELHLSEIKWRLANRYKVDVEYIAPKVPYRETIQKSARGSYRHKKQSGGAGQFAEVHMLIEPWRENMPNPEGLQVRGKELIKLDWGGNLEYVNSIVGGVIDQRFMPAILKGVMEKMQFGPLTGSYVRDIRVVIFDGKMHPVDSNEAAFKTASMMVFKDTFTQASPKILEPIYNVEIKVPEDCVGDVMSDLPTRRGVILGIESEGRYQKIKARMPLAELDKYATGLRSMTQGRATYSSEYAEYQAVPPNVQQELIDNYKKQQEEE